MMRAAKGAESAAIRVPGSVWQLVRPRKLR